MAYIAVVSVSTLAAAEIDYGAAFVATCIAAAISLAAIGLMVCCVGGRMLKSIPSNSVAYPMEFGVTFAWNP